MLSRQLQRPLSRPIAVAWLTDPNVLVYCGRNQRQFFSRTTPCRKSEKPLFEELFPEEAAKLRKAKAATASQEPKTSYIPPGSIWTDFDPDMKLAPDAASEPPKLVHDHMSKLKEEVSKSNGSEASASKADSNQILVLYAASKTLAASDFFRLGDTGKHIEGWVRGIIKIVPGRDVDTLEPLGYYYVFFESPVTALAYKDEVQRLWEQMKDRGNLGSQIRWGDGAVAQHSVENFTLVAPGQRLHLEVADKREESAMKHYGTVVDKLKQKLKSKFLVLISVEGGLIPVYTLELAIREDGKDRNLEWKIKNLRNKGIVPFGRRLYKQGLASLEQRMREEGRRYLGLYKEDITAENPRSKYMLYSSFIVPFLDEAEALRFVRNWHRRQLKLQSEEDSEIRTLNTSLLW